MAGLIENYELIAEVMKTAEESEGSALRENQRYIESIEGSINRLSSAWDALWVNENNREVITFFIDLGTSVLKVVEEFGVLKTLLVGGGGIFAGFQAIQSKGRLKKSSLIFM